MAKLVDASVVGMNECVPTFLVIWALGSSQIAHVGTSHGKANFD